MKFQSVVGPQTDVQETWRRGPEEHVCMCVEGRGWVCRHLPTFPEWIPAPHSLSTLSPLAVPK